MPKADKMGIWGQSPLGIPIFGALAAISLGGRGTFFFARVVHMGSIGALAAIPFWAAIIKTLGARAQMKEGKDRRTQSPNEERE